MWKLSRNVKPFQGGMGNLTWLVPSFSPSKYLPPLPYKRPRMSWGDSRGHDLVNEYILAFMFTLRDLNSLELWLERYL